ncbi:hypothetical protein F383_32525 [Gossypium arboreum]|uniref:Uncharacterized protein n=1 Tax=Gossypium arboreum TaxID=29729 RepID=A0A0B0N4Y5_GOSAR|nr:hypothetical protein F383_32525 [Gossypium arboreum]
MTLAYTCNILYIQSSKSTNKMIDSAMTYS